MTITYKIINNDSRIPEFIEGCGYSIIYKFEYEIYYYKYFILNENVVYSNNILENELLKYNKPDDIEEITKIDPWDGKYQISYEGYNETILIDILKYSDSIWYSEGLNSKLVLKNNLLTIYSDEYEQIPEESELVSLFYIKTNRIPGILYRKIRDSLGMNKNIQVTNCSSYDYEYSVYQNENIIHVMSDYSGNMKGIIDSKNNSIVFETISPLPKEPKNFLGCFNWNLNLSIEEFHNNILNILGKNNYKFYYLT